jgi:hypothetical protein
VAKDFARHALACIEGCARQAYGASIMVETSHLLRAPAWAASSAAVCLWRALHIVMRYPDTGARVHLICALDFALSAL